MGAHSIRQYERFAKILGESEAKVFVTDLETYMEETLSDKLSLLATKNDHFLLKEDVQSVKTEVVILKIDLRFDRMDQRLDKIEQRLDKIDQRLDKIEQQSVEFKHDLIKWMVTLWASTLLMMLGILLK